MSRRVRNAAKSLLAQMYRTVLRAGLAVLPNHYYSPIADVLDLKKTRESWARRSSMTGIDTDIRTQPARLIEMVGPFETEYSGNHAMKEAEAKRFGLGFGYIEAQCLHGVLRWLKPKRIMEIGAGVSTYCAVRASALNAAEGLPAEITCVEPHPSGYLLGSSDINLISRKVQELAPSEFDHLESGDFLFIDSSHAVKPGGDVIYLYTEVLPRLRPGVVIQIHDIYFPYLYQRDILDTFFQWTETALLQALLTNSSHLSILFSLSMLHYDAQADLKRVFPEYSPQQAFTAWPKPVRRAISPLQFIFKQCDRALQAGMPRVGAPFRWSRPSGGPRRREAFFAGIGHFERLGQARRQPTG